MRRIKRLVLGEVAQAYLRERQSSVSKPATIGKANVQQIWKSARQGAGMTDVLGTLQSMMGSRQRCMYCLDSHGCDIEHFRPKTRFPKSMFRWNNLLLCCTECGRFKGEKFPMRGNRPMLIDPTKAEPWDDLDFDPTTGNITARFDLEADDFSAIGQHTVNTLQLDQREALAVGYLATYKKLRAVINGFLNTPSQEVQAFIDELIDEDERGMLGWCFKGTGQNEAPLRQLRRQHQAVWQSCLSAFKYR